MKILKTSNGYVVHHDDGSKAYNARDYVVSVDGVEMSGVCMGADADEGWADILAQKDADGNEYIGPYNGGLKPGVPCLMVGPDKKPIIRRVHGKVEISLRDLLPSPL